MKIARKLRIVFTVALTLFVLGCSNENTNPIESLNALIGDQSYLETYGEMPTVNTSEKERIKTHLKWVGIQLGNADITHLSEEQKAKRKLALSLLNTYRRSELFPINNEYKGRRPCFKDDQGRLCAMAYLIQRTSGVKVVDEINKNHQYSYIMDMNLSVVSNWATEYGFSLTDCAKIQPTYNYKYRNPGSGGKLAPPAVKLEDGYHKLYNKNKQIHMDGEFKNGILFNGKLFVYDENGLLKKIEIYKSGKYHSNAPIEQFDK